MTRTVKDPEERREELIAAAQELFYRQGYDNTSVGDIVRSVGVAKGTFYYYFDSKQAILEALVEALIGRMLALMQEVIADEQLDALEKWRRALQAVGSWKLERKPEMLALMRMLQQPDNVLLWHGITSAAQRDAPPVLAEIIQQGCREGVFDTAYPQEAAEIAMLIMQNLSQPLIEVVLNPQPGGEGLSLARRKVAAAEQAIEAVLGAAPGSLPIFSPQALQDWFGEPQEEAPPAAARPAFNHRR